MRGAARTVSGFGLLNGLLLLCRTWRAFKRRCRAGPISCSLLHRAHTHTLLPPRPTEANQPWHQAARRPPSLHQAFGGVAYGVEASCITTPTAPKCATVLPCGSVPPGMGLFWAPRDLGAFCFFRGSSRLSKRVYTLKYGQVNNNFRHKILVSLLIMHPSPCARGKSLAYNLVAQASSVASRGNIGLRSP